MPKIYIVILSSFVVKSMAKEYILDVSLNLICSMKGSELNACLVIRSANDGVADGIVAGNYHLYENGAIMSVSSASLKVTEYRFGRLKSVDNLNILNLYGFPDNTR